MDYRNAVKDNQKLLTYWMPWNGNPSRVNYDCGYRQTDLGIAASQVDCMKAAGFDGAILAWQGPQRLFTHQAFKQMVYALVKKQMLIMVLLDQYIGKGFTNPTQATIDSINSIEFQTLLPLFTENWIVEYDLFKTANVNVSLVKTACPSVSILSKHSGYSWPEVQPTIEQTLSILKADNNNPLMKLPCVFKGFNDSGFPNGGSGVGDPTHWDGTYDYNKSVWGGPVRIIPSRGSKTYYDTSALVPVISKYVTVSTWNDYQEGTNIEDECSRATNIKIGS